MRAFSPNPMEALENGWLEPSRYRSIVPAVSKVLPSFRTVTMKDSPAAPGTTAPEVATAPVGVAHATKGTSMPCSSASLFSALTMCVASAESMLPDVKNVVI